LPITTYPELGNSPTTGNLTHSGFLKIEKLHIKITQITNVGTLIVIVRAGMVTLYTIKLEPDHTTLFGKSINKFTSGINRFMYKDSKIKFG
jgi:hypothetical protein